MQDTTSAPGKPAIASKGGPSETSAPGSPGLLKRADFGLHVTGRIDSKSEVVHREGVSAGGRPWAFYQQTVSVTVGGQLFEVNFRSDEKPDGDLCPHELDDSVKLKVGNPRMYAGKCSFAA